MTEHDLFTQMLFVDAIIGAGFPHTLVEHYAERGGLAHTEGIGGTTVTGWDRDALELLPTNILQELYTSLKLYEVTHAS